MTPASPPPPFDPEAEIHIAGILVQVRPEAATPVAASLSRLPQAEVHAQGNLGKLVVVCECASTAETLALMDYMRDLPGVVNVALVYHHAERAGALEEVIGHENDSP